MKKEGTRRKRVLSLGTIRGNLKSRGLREGDPLVGSGVRPVALVSGQRRGAPGQEPKWGSGGHLIFAGVKHLFLLHNANLTRKALLRIWPPNHVASLLYR